MGIDSFSEKQFRTGWLLQQCERRFIPLTNSKHLLSEQGTLRCECRSTKRQANGRAGERPVGHRAHLLPNCILEVEGAFLSWNACLFYSPSSRLHRFTSKLFTSNLAPVRGSHPKCNLKWRRKPTNERTKETLKSSFFLFPVAAPAVADAIIVVVVVVVVAESCRWTNATLIYWHALDT